MTEPLEMLLVNYAKKWREAGNPFRLATQLLFVRDGELVASIRADADDEDLLRIAPYAVAAYSPDATAIVLDDVYSPIAGSPQPSMPPWAQVADDRDQRDGLFVTIVRSNELSLTTFIPYEITDDLTLVWSDAFESDVPPDSALLASGLQDFMDGRTRRRANPRISAALADVITTQILNGHRRRVTIRLHALLGSRRHEELVQEARLNGLSQDALEPQ